MEHLRDFNRERGRRRNETDPLTKFAPVGTKNCEMKCDRDVLMTKDGPVIICNGCNRIVMDNRNL